MWDQLNCRCPPRRPVRIIPTYVGSTHFLSLSFCRPPNHSHVCGINGLNTWFLRIHHESFPRMWDQPHPPVMTKEEIRIIPTYVGSTGPLVQVERSATNHSHVCGINKAPFITVVISCESFPRMWDQHRLQSFRSVRYRIIPTYVGSTSPVDLFHPVRPNHSHVCGINKFEDEAHTPVFESFPRMWDQLGQDVIRAEVSRIIPTYVGSTQHHGGQDRQPPNHSHVCGINVQCLHSGECHRESFPRMWDQRPVAAGADLVERIIPTYVGSTRGWWRISYL